MAITETLGNWRSAGGLALLFSLPSLPPPSCQKPSDFQTWLSEKECSLIGIPGSRKQGSSSCVLLLSVKTSQVGRIQTSFLRFFFFFLPLNFEETPGKYLGAWQIVLLLHTFKFGYSPIILPQMAMDAVNKWDGASFVKSWISLLVNALELVTGRNGHAASNILKGNYEVCGFSVSENLAHRKHEKTKQNKPNCFQLSYIVYCKQQKPVQEMFLSPHQVFLSKTVL